MGILTPAIRITFSKREALVRVTIRYFVVKHVFNKIEKLRAKIQLFYENEVLYSQISVSFWQKITFLVDFATFLRNVYSY